MVPSRTWTTGSATRGRVVRSRPDSRMLILGSATNPRMGKDLPMATPGTANPRPGLSVGPTSEFSLFFRVKAGEGAALRAALRDLQRDAGVPAR